MGVGCLVKGLDNETFIESIREKSYVRHVLARHIQTNEYDLVRELRQKHGM